MFDNTDTLQKISTALNAGDYSSTEITKYFFERIKRYEQINCFITLTEERALEQACLADKRIKSGDADLLTGIPYAHKDIFCTRNTLTTCGSKMLHNFVAPYDATVTRKLDEAGMVMLGKTNMDEFAMGSSTETSYYGVTHNPWGQEYVPGGSSGGSAAAVAAYLAPCATGTDTGGSIRQPASFCGVTGIKPTYGRVSRYGMVAYASSLDQGGVFGRSVADCAVLLKQIAGFDERDSTSAQEPVPDYSTEMDTDIRGMRIGIPAEYFGEGMDAGIRQMVEQAIRQFEKLGCEIIELTLPSLKFAIPAYYIIAPAECSSNLARYDGVRYGYRCQDAKDLADLYTRSRAEAFGDEVKRRILIGSYVLSAGYYDAYYLKAQQVRHKIKNDFVQALHKTDAILGPVAPTTAFRIGEKTDDPVAMYLSDIYTIAVNLAGLPGLALPAGFSEGMPVGIQLIGNYFHENKLLALGHTYQQVTDWHCQMPQEFSL